MPLSFIVLPVIALFFGISLYDQEFAFQLFTYLVCTIVVNGILFVVALMNGVSHAGTGWTIGAQIAHIITIAFFVAWNIWWTWYVFF